FTSDGSYRVPGWEASVTCSPPPPCVPPTITLEDVTAYEAEFSWNAVSNAEGYTWYVFADGADPEVDTALFNGNVLGTTAIVSGLTDYTAYDFYVMTDCGATDGESVYSSKVNFTTNITLPACGENFYDTGEATGNYGNSENYTVTIFPDNPGDLVTVSFTAFNTESGWDGLMIYDGDSTSAPFISSGSTYGRTTCPIGAWTGATTYSANGHSFTSTHSSGALTFVFTSDWGNTGSGWEASVTCAPPPTCVPPTEITLGDVTAYEAEFTWDAVSNAEGYNWYVFVDGADPEVDTALFNGNVSSPTATVTGLTGGTAYDFYIMTDCGATDGESLLSSAVSFTTEIACPTPMSLTYTQLSVTSAELSWTSAGALFELEWGEAGFTQGA